MTNEEINKIIAEYCGWKYEFNGNDEDPEWYWIPPNNPDGNGTPPDYCNDLNAMHEAKETLNFHQQTDYERNLIIQYNDLPMTNEFFATARQCAEAFLRTIGKWKD
jgi:hypothetical protein